MNGLADRYLDWLLMTSWQASILVVLVMLVQWCFRPVLSARWRYLLWFLVVGRLLLPSLPESPTSLYCYIPASPAPIIAAGMDTSLPPRPALPETAPTTQLAPMTSSMVTSRTSAPSALFRWKNLLCLIWVLGVVTLTIWLIVRTIRFHCQVNTEGRRVDGSILEIAKSVAHELEWKRPIQVLESHAVEAPAVVGLFCPLLLLPVGLTRQLSEEDLLMIFRHEIAHLKRGDLFVNLLISLLQIFHWFNPFLWWAFARMRGDRELATDALALTATGNAREAYGATLLKLLSYQPSRLSLSTLISLNVEHRGIQDRIERIARLKNNAYAWSAFGALLIAVLGILTLTKAPAAESLSSEMSQPVTINGHSDGTSHPSSTLAPETSSTIPKKLQSIVVDKVDFNNLDLAMAVQFLTDKSKDLDPEHTGINIVLCLPENMASTPAPHSADATARNKEIHRKISLSLVNVPLGQVLNCIAQQTNLQLSVDADAVYLRPSMDAGQTLTVRTFLVPRNFFAAPPAVNNQNAKAPSGSPDVRAQLLSRGISFPEGAEAVFLPASSKLVVRNTPEQLDFLADLIGYSGQSTSPASVSPAPPSNRRLRSNLIQHKLQSINLSVNFVNATIQDITSYLSSKSKELDPDKQGVDFVVRPEASSSAKPVTLNLNNVSLGEALRYVCLLAGVQFRVQENSITIAPINQKNELISRTFQVQPNFLVPGGFQPGDARAAASVFGFQAQKVIESKGIQFAPGGSAVYFSSTGSLIVVDTAEQLELLEDLVDASAAPQH